MTTKRIDGETVELIEVHQLDYDFCGETYGVLPCTATLGLIDADDKCYNTLATCQDTPNYNQTTKTLTLSQPQTATLKEQREILGDYYAKFDGNSRVTMAQSFQPQSNWTLEVSFNFTGSNAIQHIFDSKLNGADVFGLRLINKILEVRFQGGGQDITGVAITPNEDTKVVIIKTPTTVSLSIKSDTVDFYVIENRTITVPVYVNEFIVGQNFQSPSYTQGLIGNIWDFKVTSGVSTILDIPFNGSSVDLSGNVSPVDINITYFTEPSTFVDSTVYTIPVLTKNGTTTSPTKVSIGAQNPNQSPLGNFGTLSVNYQDIPHNDNIVDPYRLERSWDALDRGTFFTKFLARNQYYNARNYRVLTGFAGQYIADFEVKHYLQDTISRPNSAGRCSLNGVSPFRRLDDRKAQYPTESNSKLILDFAIGATTLEVDNTVNSANELEENLIYIGGEIIKYTTETITVGVKTVYTGCVRAQHGTDERDHKVDDSAQHTIFFDRNKATSSLYEILKTLFNTGNFVDSILDLSEWQTEIGQWLITYSRLERVIFKPTSIKELIGELSKECGFFTWFEETENLVKLKAIRPEIGSLVRLTEANDLLGGQTTPKSKTDSRISEVVVDSNLFAANSDPTKRISYRNTNVRFSDTSSPEKYGQKSIFEIKARWLYTQTQINTLTSRVLRRYEDDAQFIDFKVDIKNDLTVGQVFELLTSRYVDTNGLQELRQWQVLSRHREGDTISFSVQEFYITGNYFVIAPNGTPDYDTATDEDKSTYGYIGPLPDGTEYTIF